MSGKAESDTSSRSIDRAEMRADAAELQALAAEADRHAVIDDLSAANYRAAALEEALQAAEDRAEAAERRLAAKNLLLSEFEHKLKSSFLVLQGWAQMLDDNWADLTDARRAAGVHSIRVRTEEVVHEAREMLDEAHAESAIVELQPSEIDLARVLSLAAVNAGSSHLFAYEGEPVVLASTDLAAIQQVLSQLLENATIYAPRGSVITMRARYVDDDWCEFTVSDEGPGLPAAIDIFAPFVRGSRDRPGSGIGLYIVRKLVDALGGTVTASDNADGGACFTVRLPRV